MKIDKFGYTLFIFFERGITMTNEKVKVENKLEGILLGMFLSLIKENRSFSLSNAMDVYKEGICCVCGDGDVLYLERRDQNGFVMRD